MTRAFQREFKPATERIQPSYESSAYFNIGTFGDIGTYVASLNFKKDLKIQLTIKDHNYQLFWCRITLL